MLIFYYCIYFRFHLSQEAASILEEMLNEIEDEIETCRIRDVLATAYYQQAVLLYEERMKTSINNINENLSKVVDDCLERDASEYKDELLDQYKVLEFGIFWN